MVAEESVLLTICGRLGAPGKVEASGARKKLMLGFVGDSNLNVADQVAFPLLDDATQVYCPLSDLSKSVIKLRRNHFIQTRKIKFLFDANLGYVMFRYRIC